MAMHSILTGFEAVNLMQLMLQEGEPLYENGVVILCTLPAMQPYICSTWLQGVCIYRRLQHIEEFAYMQEKVIRICCMLQDAS